jgi:glycosyltransferase involved in cell wall biosynthesis
MTQTTSASSIVVNTRSLSANLSGVQRYTLELCARFGTQVASISPTKPMQGITGHLWEQIRLPLMIGSQLLWSPANSGPVTMRRQVVTLHDIATIDHPEWFNAKFAGWYRWMIPRLVRRVLRVITGSEFTKRRLVEISGVDESRIVVIPDGVDRRFYPRPEHETEMVRKELGIPSSRYVFSLGTLEPRKNIPRQLQAWAQSVAHLPQDLWLVVAGATGKGHVFGTLNLDNLPPRVHLMGFVPDEKLPALYSGAIAQLCPSLYEGFGLPALEAMAAGTVPIASNCSSLPEVVGNTGILVDPNDTDAIATAIVRIVNDLPMREQLRHRAIARSKAFGWDRTAELTWRVLAEVSAQ